MFNTGYGLLPDFGPYAEGADGPTLRHLSRRSRQWGMGIAAGFVERDGRHLYDALALCLPGGSIHVYRKRHLVFWEPFRFRPGRTPLVVATPWGAIGLAICADMMDRRVWDDYRGRIDLAVIASAWPEFACRHSGRRHCLFGHVGPMAAPIPAKVARDLDVPSSSRTSAARPARRSRCSAWRWPCTSPTGSPAGAASVTAALASPVIAGAGPQLVLSEVDRSRIPQESSHEILCARRSRRLVFPGRHGLDRHDGLPGLLAGQPPSRRRELDGALIARMSSPARSYGEPAAYGAIGAGSSPAHRRAGARPWRGSTADATRRGASSASGRTGPAGAGRSGRRS